MGMSTPKIRRWEQSDQRQREGQRGADPELLSGLWKGTTGTDGRDLEGRASQFDLQLTREQD